MHLQVLLTLSTGVLAAGMTCSMIFDELGEETCGEDMSAACPEDSQCRNLIAQGLETCTEEDMVYDEEGYYISALAGIREAEAGVRLACSPCGGAFMQFHMMVEDASVCGEENIMSVCQAGTLCHGAMQNVTNTCTDDDIFFDGADFVKSLDIVGEFSMLCSPCGMAFGGLMSSCADEETRCDGPCQTALDTLRSTCTDEDILPGMDESESLDDYLWFFDHACASMPEPKCVELPRHHPIWSSPVMNNRKPMECNVMN